MMLSLADAASASGVSKSTLTRAIKGGRLTAQRQDSGAFLVDAAELHRAFPIKPVQSNGHAAPDDASRINVVVQLQERVAGLEALLSEVRASRDAWQQQAERLALAPPPSPLPAAEAPVRRRWWRWG